MDFPLIRRQAASFDATSYINGLIGDSRPHVPERNLPGGSNWVVQKFGGTSVGKFPIKIAEDIVQAGLKPGQRIAVVCSARSSSTKSEGTTNRLVRAALDVLDPEAGDFREVVERIRLDHLQAGHDACHAYGGGSDETNEILAQYNREVNAECLRLVKILESAQFLQAVTDQTEDMVISAGEKLSCLYMSALLLSRGVPAAYVDLSEVVTFDVGKSLDEDFYRRLGLAIAERIHALGPDVVPVITGYFGRVPGGLLKEVGRGYTDLCAALTAVGLRARELQIWKEVDGIFTADPRKVPTAHLLDSVTPSEAAELTFYGSEVIHPFTMDQVIKASIPIRIKNVMNPRNQGTVVLPTRDDDDAAAIALQRGGLIRSRSTSTVSSLAFGNGNGHGTNGHHAVIAGRSKPKRPTAVTIKRGITVLNVHSKRRTRAHGFLASIFQILDRHHLSVDLISSSEVHVSMALHSEIGLLSGAVGDGDAELRIASAALAAAVEDLGDWGLVDLVPHMAIISLVGRELRSMVGISGRFFATLGEHGINIEMISQGASEINISCVIEEANADRALNVVHTNLFTFLD